jgi:hypothetical protein
MMFDFIWKEYPQNGSPTGIAMDGHEDADASSLEPSNLEQLQQEDASLFALIRILLSVSTLPHIVMILVLSSLLQIAAVQDLESLSALGFLSLSGGYFLTGLLAGRATVQRWIRLPEQAEEGRSALSRLFGSFRICLFPLVMAAVVFASLVALVGEQGAIGDLTGILPLALSSCFVVWAIVQGRGFGRWLSSVAASKLPSADAREPGLSSRSTVVPFIVVFLITVLLLYVFEMLADSSTGMMDVLVGNLAFLAVVSAVFLLAWRRSRDVRLKASSRSDFHRFGGRWMLLSQVMITWHLLTVWRHQFITPATVLLVAEEVALMAFTVLMAIWGLTSRSFRSPLKLVTTKNALPMGLAFGYAYAGSVAMLTTVLQDVQNVMMAGHLVVALTFLWMQPRVLGQTIGHVESVEHIKRVVDEAVVAPGPSTESAEVPEEPSLIQDVGDEQTAEVPAESQDPVQDIGGEVEWKEPDVLATEVEWDDEIELLD